MATAKNNYTVTGHLVRDVSVKTVGDLPIGEFSIAVNEKVKGSDGNWSDRANFFDCTIFGRRAEALSQYTGKGSKVVLFGSLRQDRWQDKDDGSNRSKVKLIVDDFEFAGSNAGESGNGASNQPTRSSQGSGQGRSTPADYGQPINAEDIPF